MEKDWKSAVQKLAEQIGSWVSKDFSRPGSLILHELTMDPTPDEPLLEIRWIGVRFCALNPPHSLQGGFLRTSIFTLTQLFAEPCLSARRRRRFDELRLE